MTTTGPADTTRDVVVLGSSQDAVAALATQLAQLLPRPPSTWTPADGGEPASVAGPATSYVHVVDDPRAAAASAGVEQWTTTHASVLELLRSVAFRHQVQVHAAANGDWDHAVHVSACHLGVWAPPAPPPPATGPRAGLPVSPSEALVRARLGLRGGDVDRLRRDVVVAQREEQRAWTGRSGVWSHPVAPAAGRQPVFWILQNGHELDALRAAAPPGAAITVLRSAYRVGREPGVLDVLAELLADEIGLSQPRGEVLLGGNCQGGLLAHRVARVLAERGRTIGLLWLLDAQLRVSWPGALLLLFGRESTDFNPRLAAEDQGPLLARLHPDLEVQEVPGGHGQYFRRDNLAHLLATVLAAADERRDVAA